ncbi:hypothetical protein D3C78_420290 [compost metagenome]
MQHREVEVVEPAAHEVFHQVAHQGLAYAGPAALRVHRQAPEAGAAVGVVKGLAVVEAHDGAYHLAVAFVLGQPVDRPAQVERGDGVLVHGQHAAAAVELVDRLPVGLALCPADAEATKAPARRAIVGEPEAQGVGGVEEQLLRRQGQHLLGGGDVQGDVAFAGLFVQQLAGQARRVGEGMAEEQAAPTAVEYLRCFVRLLVTFGQLRLQALVGGRLAAQQPLAVQGMGFHRFRVPVG